MWQNVARSTCLLLACAVAILVLTACEPDYREAGRRSGEAYSKAGTTVAEEVEERGPTVVAEVEERGPTVVAEIEERAPTVVAEADEAAREFSEGLRETGACGGAATILVFGGLMAAIVPRRPR